MKTLLDSGIVSSIENGVKLLGEGGPSFAARIDIEVTQASGGAIAAVEAAGGRIKSGAYVGRCGRGHGGGDEGAW